MYSIHKIIFNIHSEVNRNMNENDHWCEFSKLFEIIFLFVN